MRGADISQPKLFITNTVSDFVPKDQSAQAKDDRDDVWLGQTIRRIAANDVSRAGSSEWRGDPDGDSVQFVANSQFATGVVEMKKKMANGRPLGIEKLKK